MSGKRKGKSTQGARNPRGIAEKITECRFFLERMSAYESSGEISSLLHCLSAFLSAFRSILFRLNGVMAHSPNTGSRVLLEVHLRAHPEIKFLREASNVEVHQDGVTVWPQFHLVDPRLSRPPGPMELHFFPQMASQVRVISLRLENQKSNLLYSSSRLVTLGLLWFCFPLLEEFEWSEVAQRLMRTHAVVGLLPLAQLPVERGHVPSLDRHFVELLVVGAMGPLHVSVQFGRAPRQHEQRNLALLAGQLELGRELTPAIHLQGGDTERHALQQRIEEPCGRQ